MGPLRFVIEPYDGASGTVPRLHYHPYSWIKAASVLFVDSPVGAGFSFSRDPRGYGVGEVSSSLQLKTFLTKWFTEHPDFLSNHFYVGGDSYAGKIVPNVAQKISEDIEAGLKPTINLKGYLVGNPITGEAIDMDSRVPYLHGVGVISDQLYETIMEHCHGEPYDNPKNVICAQAMDRFKAGYITYLAYVWANNNITRENLGIKAGSMGEWVRCHEKDLPFTHDIESSIKYHRNITSKGYRALVYSGDHDAVVPFLGTQSWVRSLNFPIMDEWRAWHLDGQSAGFTIAYTNNMTFATVKGGGHTAPSYQPERCLAMLRRWISNEPL
uniref:Serine carboxypeptidase-like 19 n=1 Tax=Aegilops tauschii subsp. strangulata TaxID=200361 RepID=A0A453AD59_AEGTS